MKTALRIFITLLFTFSIQAGIVHVPGDQPGIQAGIVAAQDGDTVLVADSTYIENINFLGKAITVASHFIIDGDSSHIANTIIDGSQPSHPDSGSVVTFESGEDTTSVLSGFTITGGSGTISELTGLGNVIPVRVGGGILCYLTGAKIVHNYIRDNHISLYNLAAGGGISCSPWGGYAGHVIIAENQIVNNSVNGIDESWAGAIDVNTSGRIVDNEISSNVSNADLGSGLAWGAVYCASADTLPQNVLIKNNRIINNTAIGFFGAGGGLTTEAGTNAVITGNLIADNVLTSGNIGSGAGIYINEVSGNIEIDGNRIERNRIPANTGLGGGIRLRITGTLSNNNIRISNNIIVNNEGSSGGGISSWNSRSEIINNTIVNNTGRSRGGGMRFDGNVSVQATVVLNTILWGNASPNGPQVSVAGSGAADVLQCDVEGGYTGEGNINCDPLFVDTLAYELSDSSCAIGAGIDSMQIGGIWYHAPAVDYNGNMRPNPAGSMPDIGAHESARASPLVAIEPLPAAGLPLNYRLEQNYPNPFNPNTTIEFAVTKSGWVTLRIYNVLGEEVSELVSQRLSTGSYRYEWDATGLASGVYYYQLKAENYSQTRKLVLLR